jgi:drug/metabolite transporter (DMT)-like permease
LPSSDSRLRADLALVIVAAVWGATFFMIKDALQAVPPLWFMALRFGLAAVLLAPFAMPGVWDGGIRAGVLVGLLLFLGYALQTLGLQFTSASRAGFITGLAVVLVPCAEALIFGSRPSRAAVVGVGLSVAGMALLAFGANDPGLVAQGDVLVLGCALAFSAHILAVGRYAPRLNPLRLTFVQALTVAALSLALASVLETFPVAGSAAALPAVGFTALFATVGAYYVQARAQSFTSPTHTALIFALEPVFAAAFAFALAGERLTHMELAGCVLIVVGMVAATLENQPGPSLGQ